MNSSRIASLHVFLCQVNDSAASLLPLKRSACGCRLIRLEIDGAISATVRTASFERFALPLTGSPARLKKWLDKLISF
jgi:hypothetical protein